jgi:hypothetical protein
VGYKVSLRPAWFTDPLSKTNKQTNKKTKKCKREGERLRKGHLKMEVGWSSVACMPGD